MREILFKAKRIDNGEWVEGSYIKSQPINEYAKTNASMIICENGKGKLVQIDETTLCQYTGMTDKNGNKIWENDILEWEFENIPSDYYECVWLEDECAFAFKNGNDYTNPVDCYDEYSDHFCMKVIGTTFDNPELVKGGAT